MGRKGTVRKDILRTCPACDVEVRPCNLLRHLRAAHPGHPVIADMEMEPIRRALQDSGWR